ncbi:hypothetical protein RASY3_01490 [Ruminococcus albus SY3]|uniref:Insertion element IS150 protein InsJ-like helix-turn-helix domain-containing protein n=1 Tax=Ruminococcus albus SY3 TaxID=1341156 RepID=A0A011V4Y2_RUMAL|nr:helix-turn-helix domain-containing protein [Ruminococcus albus]EXM40547.1 hypothetical protein RASY3_01490 [Ruminococcus albus SY3]
MTNEQRNQVAAMNASGMSIDEIVLDTKLDRKEVEDFVAERNAKKKGRGHSISAQTKQAIIEWYQSGHPVSQTAKKFGVDPKTVKAAVGLLPAKEKEPTAAATATDSKEKIVQVQNTTSKPESQALRGVEVIGLMQTMLIGIEENFGDNVEVMSLRADSDTASIVFRYGGTAYSVQFGLAF